MRFVPDGPTALATPQTNLGRPLVGPRGFVLGFTPVERGLGVN
jgi:hypothetical protein